MTEQKIQHGFQGADVFLSSFLNAASRVFAVCGSNSYALSGAAEWFADKLPSNISHFHDFSPNPKDKEIEAGITLFKEFQPEVIIAVGGGSAIDVAKLINFFGTIPFSLQEYVQCPQDVQFEPLPLLAVPTTAGSGSEATHFAVLYHAGNKHSVAHPSMLPSHVLLAPELTYSLNTYQTACCGMDALAQGIESMWAVAANTESRKYARKAIDLALANIVEAVKKPTPANRAAMQQSAHFAGKAINISKTTGPHALSYILTTTFNIPHGHAVGLLLPHFIRLHHQAGISVEGVTPEKIKQIITETGLQRTLPTSPPEVKHLFEQHANADRLKNNPVNLDNLFLSELSTVLCSPA